jgi:hypothetical protein
MGWARFVTQIREKRNSEFWWGKLMKLNHYEDLYADGMTILYWTLK